jgi:hypothetical protein
MQVAPRVCGWILALAAVLVAAQPAMPREKSDIIVLKNNNQITGEIKRLHRGMLTVKTDAMGTLDIKWEDVTHVSSKFVFIVEDSRGGRYVGTLESMEEAQRLNVIGPNPARGLNHLLVVELNEVGSTLWNRLSGSVEFGYTYTKASELKQFNLNTDLSYRTKRYETQFSYDSVFSSSNGEQDADRKVLSLGGSRYIRKRWQLLSKAMWEHNLELQLDRRFSFLFAPAYDIRKTNRSSFLLIGGIAYSRESYLGQPVKNNVESAFGFNAQVFKLYSPKVDVTSSFFVLPNLTTTGRVRMEFDSSLRFEIFKDFFISFSVYDSYDNRPPAESATTNDYGFVTGVTWSFH